MCVCDSVCVCVCVRVCVTVCVRVFDDIKKYGMLILHVLMSFLIFLA